MRKFVSDGTHSSSEPSVIEGIINLQNFEMFEDALSRTRAGFSNEIIIRDGQPKVG